MSTARWVVRVAIACALAMPAAARLAADPLTSTEQARYADLDAKPLQSFTNVDLADYLALRHKDLAARGGSPDPGQDVGFFARKALGQRFRLNAVRFDYIESDCVVFVERAVAMALSPDWATYYRLCERLRYKDGVVQYRNRNFFTLGDWVPNNAWLLGEISGSLDDPDEPVAESFTHLVRPKVFRETPIPNSKYVRTRFLGSDYRSPDVELRSGVYIPRDAVRTVGSQLLTGDVALILQAAAGGHLGCSHMGIIVVDAEQVTLLSSAPDRVKQCPLTDLAGYSSIKGFAFLRLRSDAQTIVRAELARLGDSCRVPTPASVDAQVERTRIRAGRAALPDEGAP